MRTVKLVAVEYAFAAAASRAYIPACIASDAFAQFFLEKCELFFRAHGLDLHNLSEAIGIFCLFGLAQKLIIDLMFLAFTYVASFQHSITIGNGLISIEGLDPKFLCGITQIGSFYALNSFNAFGFYFFDIQFSFASHTDHVGFLSVDPMFLHQLYKAVGITGL